MEKMDMVDLVINICGTLRKCNIVLAFEFVCKSINTILFGGKIHETSAKYIILDLSMQLNGLGLFKQYFADNLDIYCQMSKEI